VSTAFFDTNVLVYAALQPDQRSEAAREVLHRGGIVSVQVLNEFAAVARRKLRRPWPEITTALTALRTLLPPPIPLTLATHEAAVVLAARHGLAIHDALIVAAALEAGCDTLLTKDLQHGQRIERLTIRNPFHAGA
jgi:predicted nucleic acid-binding protein